MLTSLVMRIEALIFRQIEADRALDVLYSTTAAL